MEENEVKVEQKQETVEKKTGKGLSIASLVLGIVSVVSLCWMWVSVICAVLAIIFGVIGGKRDGKGMAKAGLILGIIAASFAVIVLLFLGGSVAFLTSAMAMQ